MLQDTAVALLSMWTSNFSTWTILKNIEDSYQSSQLPQLLGNYLGMMMIKNAKFWRGVVTSKSSLRHRLKNGIEIVSFCFAFCWWFYFICEGSSVWCTAGSPLKAHSSHPAILDQTPDQVHFLSTHLFFNILLVSAQCSDERPAAIHIRLSSGNSLSGFWHRSAELQTSLV